jgi:hypothetical protein
VSAYTAGGKRRSSQTHARIGHDCDFCGGRVFGNGGAVAHGRKHVRAGEAVELVKWHSTMASPSRVFVAPDSEEHRRFLEMGFEAVSS